MMKNKIEKERKTYIVTGASSGIGYGVCESLLKSGANVIGIGRNASKIMSLLKYTMTFSFRSFDLNDIEQIEELVYHIVEKKNKIDGIVMCAGIEETIALSQYKNDKINSIFNINVLSGIELLRVFSKKKISNNNASVVFISSVMGELGQSGKVGYCATKSAVLGVVRSSSLELAKRNIRVNAVSPGVVKTPMTDNLFEKLSEDGIKSIEEMHPLGLGNIEDVTPIVLFLLSRGAKWITGQNFKVDGGYSIQ